MKLPAQLNKLVERLPIAKSKASRGSGRMAVVHWDREQIHFLVFTPKSKKLAPADVGSVPHADVANPFNALATYFREHSIAIQRLVVLLSRPELDMLTLTLPPADATELPALVASEVEQQLGETDEPPTIDFYVLPSGVDAISGSSDEATTGSQVIAFALPAAVLRSLQTRINSEGFRAAAICSRHLSPLGILRRRHVPHNTLAVSVHLYAGEAEIAICRGADPILLRSIRTSVDDPGRIAEQLWLESQRCLALLPSDVADLPFNWFMFTTCEAAWSVARALEDGKQISIQLIDPLIGWEMDPQTTTEETTKQTSAANAGAGWDFLDETLPVNLLAPKRPPKPANPMQRWIAIGSGAAMALLIAVYFLLSDVSKLTNDVQALEVELGNSKKVTAKYQEKADQVTTIENWLSDQVDWVAELNELSKRLPDGQNASVRRLMASANPKGAVIDLAVQVAKQETISQFEASIRSAKYAVSSKQISQNSDSLEYPWQFETRIVFPIEPVKDREFQIVAPAAIKQPDAPENKE